MIFTISVMERTPFNSKKYCFAQTEYLCDLVIWKKEKI